jgi:selenocysteine-specific elongation factor
MRVIGTAGHVDHGKSTLVEAITGTHPDRLKEEREREMTIDLGFAWLTLPDGEEVGIVDVPGHRDFIENMLSGVGGIDAALFVIAADEGVMPQTREHLAILDLLQVQGGVIALTKIDMVEDLEWLDLVEEDIRRVLMGTVLENAPIVRVSARKKIGIPELLLAISACLADRPPRVDHGRPRLPVDRVFTISGFGTVVTGTLIDGVLRVGDDIEILPRGLRGRVRGLQTHKQKEEIAIPGSRTAVNISGVNIDQIERGNLIAHPNQYKITGRFDAQVQMLPDVSASLRHNMEVKLFVGAAEILARIRLLGIEELIAGEEGWVQIETNQPVVVVRGDRYILRRPSPGETLGGGAVLDPHPRRRYKRFSQDTISRLEALQAGTPAEILLQTLLVLGVSPLKEVVSRSSLDAENLSLALDELTASGDLVYLEPKSKDAKPAASNTLVASRAYWQQITLKSLYEIELYHRANPLRRGMPREELKSRLKLSPRVFTALINSLTSSQVIEENGPLVNIPGHEIRYNSKQKLGIEALLARFDGNPYMPPTVKECQDAVGADVYQALLDQATLIQVAPEVVFSSEGFSEMLNQVRELLELQGTLTAAQVRDHFNTSRRYALAFLEYLDEEGITIREGDVRRLRR